MNEGAYGFARAFFVAGVKGILTCLWKVDAVFSVIFLDCFYKNYLINGQAERALAQSRNLVREMRKSDVLDWLERRRIKIETMDRGTELYDIFKKTVSLSDDNDRVFDKPVYWACFQLSRPFCCRRG